LSQAIPHHFANGLPYEADGTLALDNVGATDHVHQGLPFTVQGRLVYAGGSAVPEYFGAGAAPFQPVVDSKLAFAFAQPVTHFSGGVAYSAEGRVSVTVV
jgi:hypothetical protein